MKKFLVGASIVTGIFLNAEARAAEPAKWQQFCEGVNAASMDDTNGRLKQLGEQGWELTGVTPTFACYKRVWTKNASAIPVAVSAVACSAKVASAPAPKPVAAPTPIVAAPVATTPIAAAPVAKPADNSLSEAEAQIFAAPSVTQATTAPPPARANTEPTRASHTLVPEAGEEPAEARPRRALVPKS